MNHLEQEAVSMLVSAAWDEPYVHLEDVFFTGILAQKLGIPRRLAMELRLPSNLTKIVS